MVLVGAEGTGKTSVARVTLRRAVGRRLVTVTLDPLCRTEAGLSTTIGAALGLFHVERFEDVERALAGRRRLVLLDGLEQAFLRTPDGINHVRRLLQLIAATRDRICWVVSVAHPTARLLEKLCNLKSWFTDCIDFPPLDGHTLSLVIENRCRLSGFEARYPAPNRQERRRLGRFGGGLRRLGESERRRAFYDALTDAAGGNIRDALTLWINTISRVDGAVVTLGHVTDQPLDWFDQLSRDAHRVAAALVLCGTLSSEEGVEVMRWPTDRVEAALAALHGAQIIERDDDARYQVWAPAWRRVTEQLEARRNLIPPEASS